MNHISELQKVKTPRAWMERLDEAVGREQAARRPHGRKFSVILAAVIAAAALLAGTALAYALTGGAFFSKFFTERAGSGDYPYMDVAQLPDMAGTLYTAVDTDELRIDVIDVVSSGGDAMMALRVTAKKLDSVLIDTGWDTVRLNNYRFGGGAWMRYGDMTNTSERYIYSDEDESLADNQFYLVLTGTSQDGFTDGPYSFRLHSFGYYDRLSGGGGITAVYEGPWTVDFNLSGDTGHSRTVFLNGSVDIGEYTYDIEYVFLTPFSCTAVLDYDGAPDPSNDRSGAVRDAAADLALYTSDGTPVAHGQMQVRNGEDGLLMDSTYRLSAEFTVPVNVEDIDGLHVFGCDYDISPEAGAVSRPAVKAPEAPSYTTQWKDAEKYALYDKMLNSVDYFDYASGKLIIGTGDNKQNVAYRVNLLTGEAYEEVTDQDGNTIELIYSDGETRSIVYPQRQTVETTASRPRGEALPASGRITADLDGTAGYVCRGDATNTSYASRYSLLAQKLVMLCLSDENTWYFCGSGDMCGRDLVAVCGSINPLAAEDGERVARFEMLIDRETGVILQYLGFDADGDIIESCRTADISYEDPGSFEDAEKSVMDLTAQYR